MKNVKELCDYLESKDFIFDKAPFCFINNDLEVVTMSHKTHKDVDLNIYCNYAPDYQAEIYDMNEGEELHIDLSRCEINAIDVKGPLKTEFCEGIKLINYDDVHERNIHHLSKELLDKVIFAQLYSSEHILDIMRCHIRNTDACKMNLYPLLKKYDFIEVYNSLTYCNTKEDTIKETSNFESHFKHLSGDARFYVTTDILTGDLSVEYRNHHTANNIFDNVNFFDITEDELNDIFINKLFKDENDKLRMEFSYIFSEDEHHNIETYPEVMNMIHLYVRCIVDNKDGTLSSFDKSEIMKIDLNNIPDIEDYHKIYNQLQKLIEDENK